MKFGVAVFAVLSLGVLSLADAYSFLSCTDYDQAQDLCYGYPRRYIQWVGGASHAYNLQADLPANVDQTTVSVDTLWQVGPVNRTEAPNSQSECLLQTV